MMPQDVGQSTAVVLSTGSGYCGSWLTFSFLTFVVHRSLRVGLFSSSFPSRFHMVRFVGCQFVLNKLFGRSWIDLHDLIPPNLFIELSRTEETGGHAYLMLQQQLLMICWFYKAVVVNHAFWISIHHFHYRHSTSLRIHHITSSSVLTARSLSTSTSTPTPTPTPSPSIIHRFQFITSRSSAPSARIGLSHNINNPSSNKDNDGIMTGRGRGGGGRGRGEYYKNKYGGGGRGRGGGDGGGSTGGRGEYYRNKYGGGGGGSSSLGGGAAGGNDNSSNDRVASGGGSYDDLQRLLQRLDGKSYPAYHDLDTPLTRGWYNSNLYYTLFVERAQSDPFAPPTRCRVVVDGRQAGFPPSLYSNPVRSMALGDFLLRNLYNSCKRLGADASLGDGAGGGWQGPKGGDIQVLEPCQHVLEQSAVRIDRTNGNVIAQITINLPARGRTILGRAAEQILGSTLPTMIQQSFYYSNLPSKDELQKHVESVEDQVWLQRQLETRNLVAFVRNGAILPRISGDDDRPMDARQAVPFTSPKGGDSSNDRERQRMEVSFALPNAEITILGMGIPKGITLICGGGFHGKSTLLSVLQNGVYPKVVGDGREFCVVDPNACKIRAEDGRNVQAVDISNFINNLPYGKDTTDFSTMDASGSTSQAAFIQESIECGASTFLIDEDTCATNFMIRDDKMIQLVAPEKEPITPFVRLVRSLYDDVGISTIMVIGGTGDFFDVADNVLVMDSYRCIDATEKAKQIVASSTSPSMPHKASQGSVYLMSSRKRVLKGAAFAPNGKVRTSSRSLVSYGDTELNLSCLEQLVSKSQTVAIVNALQRLPSVCKDDQMILETLKEIDRRMDEEGLDSLSPGQCHGGMSRPRVFELAGAINRLRRNGGIRQQR